jgi:hypothetical protein
MFCLTEFARSRKMRDRPSIPPIFQSSPIVTKLRQFFEEYSTQRKRFLFFIFVSSQNFEDFFEEFWELMSKEDP